MADTDSNVRIELEAVHMVVEWKSLFAKELHLKARELAKDSPLVTKKHLLEALPTAISNVLLAARNHAQESADVKGRVA